MKLRTALAAGLALSLPASAALAQTVAPPPLPTGQELSWSSPAQRVGAFSTRAWAARGTGVTIAVIDSGIRADHLEFQGALAGGFNAFTGQTGTGAVLDASGHGTHVAGLAAARRNGAGMVGVASNARLLAVQVFQGATTSDSVVARGINWATSQRAFVMNLSLGGSQASPTMRTALQGAVGAGSLIVVAAGNEGLANPSWPARHASEAWARGQIIAVGAVDASNNIASFSNRAGDARNFYLVAPGVNLISAYPTASNAYAGMSGTSMAAPVVAGAAAVVKSAWPQLSAQSVASILFTTATDLGAPGVDAVFGRGMVNLTRAMQPVGTLGTTPRVAGTVGMSPTAAGGVTFGATSAAADAGLFEAVVFDRFGRDFGYDHGATGSDMRPDGVSILSGALAGRMAAAEQRMAVPGGTLSFTGARFSDEATGRALPDAALRFQTPEGEGWAMSFGRAAQLMGEPLAAGLAPAGRLTSEGMTAALFQGTTATVATRHTLAEGVSLTLGARAQGQERGARALDWTPAMTNRAASVEAAVSWRGEIAALSGGLSATSETGGRLGGRESAAMALDGSARTVGLHAQAALALSPRTSLTARVEAARSSGQDGAEGSIVRRVTATDSVAWSVNLARRDVFARGDQLDIAFSSPLTSTGGAMALAVATGADAVTGAALMQERRVSLATATPERRLELAWVRPVAGDGSVGFGMMSRFDADGRRGREEHALMLRVQRGF